MKRELAAISVLVLILIGGAAYYRLERMTRPTTGQFREPPAVSKEMRQMEKQMAANALRPADKQIKDPSTNVKQPNDEQTIAPKELPPDIVKAIQSVLPNATINGATLDKKDRLKLKLTSAGGKASASLLTSDQGVRGNIKEKLEASALPADIADAFHKAAPNSTIEDFEKVTEIGGTDHGQVSFVIDARSPDGKKKAVTIRGNGEVLVK